MTRPRPARIVPILVIAALAGLVPDDAAAQAPARRDKVAPVPGRFFPVSQPITGDDLERLTATTAALVQQSAQKGVRPVLVFEISPGKSSFGHSYDLAEAISRKLTGEKTVAYVPEPLSGYATLVALACDEIVLGPNASLGPITPPDEEVKQALKGELLSSLAKDTGREPDLFLGMLDRQADLHAIRTADRQYHFVLREHLEAFRAKHEVIQDEPAWEAGQRGVMTAARAREVGLAKRIADDRFEVAQNYGLPTSEDPTLGRDIVPVWVRIEGLIDTNKQKYLERRVKQARNEKVNHLFLKIDSPGGLDLAADAVADMIAGIKDMKTVAYIDDNATGVATLIALACDEIVFHKGARLGDVRQVVTGRDGQARDLDDRQLKALWEKAEALAKMNGYPPAIARAMVDPQAVVVEARDNKAGAVVLVLDEQVREEPGRYQVQQTVKSDGQTLTVTSDQAVKMRLARDVVDDEEGFKAIYGLRGRTIRTDGPTWVDDLVTTLNTPWVSGILLFIGLFMLIVELKLPGIGLPAITSALAFLLFFWSRYLSGTADQLEILLFLVGLICLALELFVFPGFGVFGMSGILLILVSVVMASHTFVWPTRSYEYNQFGQTLLQLCLTVVGVAGGAAIFGRYFPSMPLFNRMVLKPEPIGEMLDDRGKPAPDPNAPMFFLLGETGKTTSILRPSGKARFGELLVDVTADGYYIGMDERVEVIEVQGSRVTVRKV